MGWVAALQERTVFFSMIRAKNSPALRRGQEDEPQEEELVRGVSRDQNRP